MLIRFRHPRTNNVEIKLLPRWQLGEVFQDHPELEKIEVLKISRIITRRKILG